MVIFKAAASELPPNAPLPGTDPGDLFRSRILDPVNYILNQGGGAFLASLGGSSLGLVQSADNMNTWGDSFGEDPTSPPNKLPWGTLFSNSVARGSAPAGRLWMMRQTLTANSTLHHTDNNGDSFSTTFLSTSATPNPADRIIQESLADDLIFLFVRNSANTISRWTGSSWGSANPLLSSSWQMSGINENASGGTLVICSYNPTTSTSNLIGRRSTNGGSVWASQGSAVTIGEPTDFTGRQDYHSNDNEFGVAFITDTLGLAFYTIDDQASSSMTQRWTLNDSDIIGVRHVSAIQGRTQGWAIVVETATTNRLYLSLPGDYTNFQLALETNTQELGSLSNVAEAA